MEVLITQVFADHESSHNPIDVPRSWIWNLRRRIVYFGTSATSIFKGKLPIFQLWWYLNIWLIIFFLRAGLTLEKIQSCFRYGMKDLFQTAHINFFSQPRVINNTLFNKNFNYLIWELKVHIDSNLSDKWTLMCRIYLCTRSWSENRIS